jgi:hypothetical protein
MDLHTYSNLRYGPTTYSLSLIPKAKAGANVCRPATPPAGVGQLQTVSAVSQLPESNHRGSPICRTSIRPSYRRFSSSDILPSNRPDL